MDDQREIWLVEDNLIYVLDGNGTNRYWASFQSAVNLEGGYETLKAKAREAAMALNAYRLLLAYAECNEAMDAWHEGPLSRSEAWAVLKRHGWDEATETEWTFIVGLRRAALAAARGTAEGSDDGRP